MNLLIDSAEQDMLTRIWKVKANVDGRKYTYILSDYDYDRARRLYRKGALPQSLCIMKGGKWTK